MNDLILDQCLEDIRAKRATVAECLARYPDLADELKPLLETAAAVQAAPAAQPSAVFKQATRARLLRLQHPPTLGERLGLFARGGSWRYAVTAIAIVLLFIAVSGGIAYAANDSLPGSPLYPVKRAVEQVQLNLAATSEDKARAYMELADHRLSEAVTLSGRGQSQLAEQAVKEYSDDVNVAVTTVPQTNSPATQSIANTLNRQQQQLRAIQAPGVGKPAIQNALDASQKALEHLSIKPPPPAAPPPAPVPQPTSQRVPILPPAPQPTAIKMPSTTEQLGAAETPVAPTLPAPTISVPLTLPTIGPPIVPPGLVPKLTIVPLAPGVPDQRGHGK